MLSTSSPSDPFSMLSSFLQRHRHQPSRTPVVPRLIDPPPSVEKRQEKEKAWLASISSKTKNKVKESFSVSGSNSTSTSNAILVDNKRSRQRGVEFIKQPTSTSQTSRSDHSTAASDVGLLSPDDCLRVHPLHRGHGSARHTRTSTDTSAASAVSSISHLSENSIRPRPASVWTADDSSSRIHLGLPLLRQLSRSRSSRKKRSDVEQSRAVNGSISSRPDVMVRAKVPSTGDIVSSPAVSYASGGEGSTQIRPSILKSRHVEAQPSPLARRLQELEEANRNGLLNDEEYRQLKAAAFEGHLASPDGLSIPDRLGTDGESHTTVSDNPSSAPYTGSLLRLPRLQNGEGDTRSKRDDFSRTIRLARGRTR